MSSNRFNFTRAAIEALPTPAKRERYFDTKIPGLSLRVTPAGAKAFYVYRKDRGRPVEIRLGDYRELSVEEARHKAMEAAIAARKKEDPRAATRRPRHERTFGDLATWWMETAANRKKSADYDQWLLDRHLARFKNRALSSITRGEVRALHADLTTSSGPVAANRSLELLCAVFNRAIAHEIFPGPNPASRIEKNAVKSRDRRLNLSEMEVFFKAVEEAATQDMQDYVYLSLYTGMRQGNVLAMRWDEVDLKAALWRIPDTKNGDPQHVPLLDPEIAILERRRKGPSSPWVFPTRSKAGHMVEPKTGWKRIIDRANELLKEAGEPPMAKLRMHDLRRTLGSYMADTGSSLGLIGKTLGHRSQAATAIYARFSLDPVREAKARAIAAMGGAME